MLENLQKVTQHVRRLAGLNNQATRIVREEYMLHTYKHRRQSASIYAYMDMAVMYS